MVADVSKNGNHRYVHIFDYGQIHNDSDNNSAVGTLAVMIDKWKSLSHKTDDDDYIFAYQRPFEPQNTPCKINQRFQHFLKTHNLRYDETGKAYSSYSYRHGGISTALRNGASTYVVSKYCDTSESMIRRHYDHVIGSELNQDILNAATKKYTRQRQQDSARKAANALTNELTK